MKRAAPPLFLLCSFIALMIPGLASAQSSCATPWSSTATYTQGMTASENGENYVANWWTQGQDPATNSGGAGSGQPWTATGSCSAASCTAAPSAPTGLTASGTTSSSTNLSWTAVTPPAGCSVSYSISDGPSNLTTTSASDTVNSLSPSTAYTFTVEATDSAGTSPGSTVSVTTEAQGSSGGGSSFVGGWFEEWGTYYANSNVADLQNNSVAGALTHLIYAFAKPAANGSSVSCELADTYADYQKAVPQVSGATPAVAPLQGNFGALVQLKQLHPNLKVLISIGGWNPPTYNQLFDQAASTATQRQAFVSSCVNMFIQGNIASGVSTGTLFDGFDIDWEFPNANDTANFTALMTEFRNELNTLSGTTGHTYYLVADLAAGPSTPGAAADSGNDGGYDTIDIAGLSAVLDYMNVDGYNYAGDWSSATNDASPLNDDPASPLYGKGDTIDATVQYYLSHGAAPAKYTIGFPLYGAGWAGGLTSTNSGMYQTATGVTDPTGALTLNGTSPVPNANGVGNCSTGNNQGSPAAGCDVLLTDGLATYGTLVNLLNNGFTSSYDSTRCSARMFNPTTQTAFSYDNAQSVACKASYIKTNGLGGGYVWALKDDDPNGDLTKAIAAALNP
jgi:chitinase